MIINKRYSLVVAIFAIIILQSCSLAEGIFKAGMWWAFFLVALVIIGIVWLLRRGK